MNLFSTIKMAQMFPHLHFKTSSLYLQVRFLWSNEILQENYAMENNRACMITLHEIAVMLDY